MMRLLAATALSALALPTLAQTAAAYDYVVVNRVHQTAAPNREAADITVIRCASNGQQYYIYGYYRGRGPWYRTIIPPYWGNPLGGGDHHRFDQAVAAACSR